MWETFNVFCQNSNFGGPYRVQDETKAPAGEFKRAASPFPRNPDPVTRDPSFSEAEAAKQKAKEASKEVELSENYKHYGIVTDNETFKGKPMPTLPSQKRRPTPDSAPKPIITRNESFSGKPKPMLQSQGSMRLPDGKDTGRFSRQLAKV